MASGWQEAWEAAPWQAPRDLSLLDDSDDEVTALAIALKPSGKCTGPVSAAAMAGLALASLRASGWDVVRRDRPPPRCRGVSAPVTADEFATAYAARSGVTVQQLRHRGRYPERCGCGEDGCEEWAMGHQHEDALAENEMREGRRP